MTNESASDSEGSQRGMESAGTISESGVISPRASIEDLSATEIAQREMEMLLAVPDAAPIGNMSLHGVLGETWSDDLYWAIRNRLVERGLLEKGRGKGGSVKKVPVAGDAEEEIPFAAETLSAIASEGLVPPTEASSSGVRYSRELDLYEPVALVLRSQWAKEQGFDNFRVEVTARQGSDLPEGSGPDRISLWWGTGRSRTFRAVFLKWSHSNLSLPIQ